MASSTTNGRDLHTSAGSSGAKGGAHSSFACPTVDKVYVEERAAALGKRSLKKEAKVAGLKLAVSMIDLTTLEGKDSTGKVLQMCQKARWPHERSDIPSVAAVCVYPNLVPVAKKALEGSTVKVASVATAFPSGLSPLPIKLEDVRRAVEFGADEIDMVIDRGAFLTGEYAKIFDEIQAVKEACGPAHLKTILETGELGTYDAVRKASQIAMEAGSDFIKTSTGKIIGMKPAGGIRTAKQALHYLVMVKETLGDGWLTPDLFRFGASVLLNDVLMQLEKERTGNYQGDWYFSKD